MIRKAIGALLMLAGLAGLAWLVADELRYLEPAELERKPYPLRRVDLDPIEAQGGIEYFGKLKLRIYIRKDGEVDHVDVVASALPPAVTARAVRAFADTRWEPGTRSGRARRSVDIVEVDFQPPSPGVDRRVTQPAS